MWNGQEVSSGYLSKNKNPKSASSPHWNGKVYIEGVGWYWFSAWNKRADFITLKPSELTDEQAEKYCAPKPQTNGKAAPRQRNMQRNAEDETDPDIPF